MRSCSPTRCPQRWTHLAWRGETTTRDVAVHDVPGLGGMPLHRRGRLCDGADSAETRHLARHQLDFRKNMSVQARRLDDFAVHTVTGSAGTGRCETYIPTSFKHAIVAPQPSTGHPLHLSRCPQSPQPLLVAEVISLSPVPHCGTGTYFCPTFPFVSDAAQLIRGRPASGWNDAHRWRQDPTVGAAVTSGACRSRAVLWWLRWCPSSEFAARGADGWHGSNRWTGASSVAHARVRDLPMDSRARLRGRPRHACAARCAALRRASADCLKRPFPRGPPSSSSTSLSSSPLSST